MVVGLSGNVVDPSLYGTARDGIGVYTAALESALQHAGATTVRVGAPLLTSSGIRMPRGAAAMLPVPLVASIAWSRLTGLPAPFARAVEGAIDVYHATDYRVPRLRRTPVVATLYDAIPLARPEWANPRMRTLKNWVLRCAAANADRVIAISESAVDEIVTHYRVQRERIRVVHLGVADDWFDAPPSGAIDATVPALGLQPGFLLFVGTLQPRKNVDLLLDAYERLTPGVRAEHQLVIVGKYGWGVDALRTRLEAHRSGRRVLWLDYLERDVLRAVYRRAAAFVFPSLAEGFGLPVLEAFASGLPVVASDLPVMREVAGDHALLARPGDADALAAAMTDALALVRGEAADGERRAWARNFTWARCAERTMEVYRGVM